MWPMLLLESRSQQECSLAYCALLLCMLLCAVRRLDRQGLGDAAAIVIAAGMAASPSLQLLE